MSSENLSKNQQKYQARLQRSKRSKRKKQAINLTLIIVGIATIVLALYLSSQQPITEPIQRSHPMADGNALGDPNAPVIVEVYSDFKCPACEYFFESIEPQIIQEYVEAGLVYYVYRSFGDRIHPPESGITAQAVYCAGAQDKFWEMHDYIFTNSNNTSFSVKKLEKMLETMAINLGMDKNQFSSCLENETFAGLLEQDVEAGIALDIPGTPSVIVNGVLVVHVDGIRYADIQAAIEAELSADAPAE